MFEPRGGGSAAPLNKEAMVKGLWAQAYPQKRIRTPTLKIRPELEYWVVAS